MVGSSVWGVLTQPTYERLGTLRALESTPSPRFGIWCTKGSDPVKLEVILHLQGTFLCLDSHLREALEIQPGVVALYCNPTTD